MLLRTISSDTKLHFSKGRVLYSFNQHSGALKCKELGCDWQFVAYYHDIAEAILAVEPFTWSDAQEAQS